MSKIKLTGTELSSSLNSTGSFGRVDISSINIDVNSGQGQIGMSSDSQRLYLWGGSNRAAGNGAYIQLDGTNLGGGLNLYAGGATGSVQVLGNLSGSIISTGSFGHLEATKAMIGQHSIYETDFPASGSTLHIHEIVNDAGGVDFGNEANIVISTGVNQTGAQGYQGSLWFGTSDHPAAGGTANVGTQFVWRNAGIASQTTGDTGVGTGYGNLEFYTNNNSGTPSKRLEITEDGNSIFSGNVSGSITSTGSFSALKVVAAEDGTTITTDRFGLTIDGQVGYYPLTVQSPYETAARFKSTDGTAAIEIGDNSSTDNYNRIQVVGDGRMEFFVNNQEIIKLAPGGSATVFNEDSLDINFRFEGADDENLFYLDAGKNHATIGAARGNTGDEKLLVAGDVGITGSLHVSGNISTSGSIIAREFKTEFISSSIMYASGSNKFGDSTDDKHEYTGSLNISASADTPAIQIGTGNIVRTGIKISDNRAQFGYDGGYAVVQGGSTKGIKLEVNNDTFAGGTEAVIVNAAGNVGIGATEGNIAARLEVQESAGTAMMQLRPSDASSALNPLILYRSQLEGSANYFMTKGQTTYFATYDGATPTDESKMIAIAPNGTLSPQFVIGDGGSAVAKIKVGGDSNGVIITGGASGSLVSGSLTSTGSFGHITGFNLGTGPNGINMNNTNIIGVNALVFADPGPGEGLSWSNFSIYESPDDLTTNSAGNLQFVSGGTRRATIDTSGNLYAQTNITLGGDVILNPTKKLYLDGGTHTYIDEPSGDQIRLVAGGTEVLKGYSGGAIDIYGGSINRSINIGANRTGDAASFIDLVGDTTYTDYGARLIRNSGANAITDLTHRGTGALRLRCQDAGAVLFMISDAEKMRIASSGFVGIGTDSPLDLLHIKSTSTDARLVLDGHTGYDAELKFAEAGTVNYTIGHDAASGNFVIGTTNVDTNQRLVIESSGDVGIGTTNPQRQLHIKGDDNEVVVLESADTHTDIIGMDSVGSSRLRWSSGFFQFYTGGAANSAAASGGTFAMEIDENQRVGIGTTSPSHKVHIDSNGSTDSVLRIDADDARGASRYALQIVDGDTNSRGSVSISTTSGYSIDANSDINISGSKGLRIGGNYRLYGDLNYTTLRKPNGTIALYIGDSDAANYYDNTSHRFRPSGGGSNYFGQISSAGWGISRGTFAPEAKLHIGDNGDTGNALGTNSLPTSSGASIDLLKLETGTTNANQLIFSTERISNGSDWTTTRERIYRKVDATNMGYIDFGSSFSADSLMIEFGEVGVGKYMGIGGDGRVTIGTDVDTTYGLLTIEKSANEEHLSLKTDYAATNTPRGAIKWRDGSNVVGAIHTEFDGTDVSMRFGSLYNSGYNTTTRMTLTGQGYLAIGHTSPDSPLHIANNVAAGGSLGSSAPFDSFSDYQILLYDTGDSTTSYGLGITDNTMIFNSDSMYAFYVDNSKRIVIDNYGMQISGSTTSGRGVLDIEVQNGTYTDMDTAVRITNTHAEAEAGLALNTTGDALSSGITHNLTYDDNNARQPNSGRTSGYITFIGNATSGTNSRISLGGAPEGGNVTSAYMPDRFVLDFDGDTKVVSGSFIVSESIKMNTGQNLYFDGGSNTYITEGGSDDLHFVAGGAERFAANGNGLDLQGNSANKIVHTNTATRDKYRVWNSSFYTIGMDNAMSYGGLNDYAMTFQFNNDSDRGFWWGDDQHSDAQGAMSLTTDGKLVVATSLKVGEGESTTTAATTTLHVSSSGVNGILIDKDGANNDISSRLLFREQNSTIALYNTGDTFSFRTGATVNSTSGTERFQINSSGQVFAGSGLFASLADSDTGMQLAGSDVGILKAGNIEQFRWANSYGVVINEGSYASFDFRVESNNNTHALFVDSGNDTVGMFNSTPYESLDVKSLSSTSPAIVAGAPAVNGCINMAHGYSGVNGDYVNTYGTQYSSAATVLGFAVKPSTTANDTFLASCDNATFVRGAFVIDDELRFWTAGGQTGTLNNNITMTERMRITAGGEAHFDGDVVAFSSTVSDKRLKENVIEIDGALDTIQNLRGVTFNWKDETKVSEERRGKLDYGFIAQEVEEILPELVKESTTLRRKSGEHDEGNEIYKTVSYPKVIPILVEAIKEQQKQIEDLKKEIGELKK